MLNFLDKTPTWKIALGNNQIYGIEVLAWAYLTSVSIDDSFEVHKHGTFDSVEDAIAFAELVDKGEDDD
jgi:hypothetical protein